jgi:Secretion system C-terminal sorting domain
MKGSKWFLSLILLGATGMAWAQNYTSKADGAWTTASDWNNTSGWGTSTPPTDGSQGSGTITMQNNMSIAGNYVLGSPTLNIQSGKTLTVNGDMTVSGGGTVNVYGTLIITGNLTLNSNMNIEPGGEVIVEKTATVVSSSYLTVGTNATPPPYASFVVEKNLLSQSSGDITINKNARVAVFGNISDDGNGGTVLQINNGGQVYVNGNVTFSGGSDKIVNNNSTNPFGLYVNGSTTNTGGGASTTGNEGNKATMLSGDSSLYNWVKKLTNSPLPITLLYFRAGDVTFSGISLNWATATELNFDHFNLERSENGLTFTGITTVKGNGTTSVMHEYSWTDHNPFAGTNYYRLTSVDYDGKTEVFQIISVQFDVEKTAVVYPNPVVDAEVHIDLNFEPADNTLVSITDMSGNQRGSFNAEGNELLLPLSLTPGVYVIRIKNGSFQHTERLMVK